MNAFEPNNQTVETVNIMLPLGDEADDQTTAVNEVPAETASPNVHLAHPEEESSDQSVETREAAEQTPITWPSTLNHTQSSGTLD